MSKPPLLDIDSAAERLGTTERHMRRLVSERRIPYVKVGGRVRFEPTAIEQWVQDNTVAAVTR